MLREPDGLRPKTALKLYKSLIRPILEYASPVIIFGETHMKKLEQLQLDIVKKMLGLRENTKNESVRVISGIEPLEVRFGFLKLKHQFRILKKPNSSLVKTVYNAIEQHTERHGFLSECAALREKFGVPLPNNTEQSLREYGMELKAVMYNKSFQTDLAAVKASGQANILASLFPTKASYFNYRPLDLVVRVLDKQDRAVRTAFLQNLAGSSYLANRYRKKCAFCSSARGNLEHLIFDCEKLVNERLKLFVDIGTQIKKFNLKLFQVWEKAHADDDRSIINAVLFGGNFVARELRDIILFRKTHYKHSHHSDGICIRMGKWLNELAVIHEARCTTDGD